MICCSCLESPKKSGRGAQTELYPIEMLPLGRKARLNLSSNSADRGKTPFSTGVIADLARGASGIVQNPLESLESKRAKAVRNLRLRLHRATDLTEKTQTVYARSLSCPPALSPNDYIDRTLVAQEI